MDDLTSAKTAAETATSDVAKLQETIPGLLAGLRTNLTSIYQKDNPLIQAREGHLEDYLKAPSQARAEYLPANQPMVEGSPLNFSPTQLSAMVNARQAAALAPLLGTNQMIMAQYGGLNDILSGAKGLYEAQLGGAQTRATSAMDLYKQAVELEKSRQSTGGGMGDLGAILAAILAQNQQETGTEDEWEIVSDQPSSPFGPTSQPFGETSLYPGGPSVPPVPGKEGGGLNLGNIPLNFGNTQPGGLFIAGSQNPFAGLGPFNLNL